MTAGCLLLNKAPGRTSFEFLGPVKKAFSTGKVCHTGTLDKFAEGLLVVLVGPAVKLASWFTGCDKRYRGIVRFGEETDTLDPEGTVIASAPVPSEADIAGVLPRFTGQLMQAPPLYSAVHVNGRRAHTIARSGETVEMKERPVTIHSISLLSWNPPLAEIEVLCSKGTYIRSLARDIALALGSRARLASLTRTQMGGFFLEQAVSPEDGPDSGETLRHALKPLSPELFAAAGIPGMEVDAQTAGAVSHGRPPDFLAPLIEENFCKGNEKSSPPDVLAIFGPSSFAALIEKKTGGGWKYGYVNAAG